LQVGFGTHHALHFKIIWLEFPLDQVFGQVALSRDVTRALGMLVVEPACENAVD
jgi:hypothetical protein